MRVSAQILPHRFFSGVRRADGPLWANLWFVLIMCAIVQLNFQLVLYFYFGITEVGSETHPVLLFWAFCLLAVLAKSIISLMNSPGVSRLEAMALLFLFVCAVHGFLVSLSSGANTGMFAFLSWAIGIGVYLHVSRDFSLDWPVLTLKILVFCGVVNAIPVVWEAMTGQSIFKLATLLGQTRLYGISQSVSILGLQLAIGIVATVYFLTTARKRRYLFVLMAALQLAALLASTSRGPLIYMIFVLFLIVTLMPRSADRQIVNFLVASFLLCAGIVMLTVVPVQLDSDSQLSFVASALTTSDMGNMERLGYYQEALDLLFSNILTLILGEGAGMLSVASTRAGGEELGVESSVLKVLLELGLLGTIPFLAVAIGTALMGARIWLRKRRREALFLTGCFVILLFQMTSHEALKAWIGSVYFWLMAGGILHIRLAMNRPAANSVGRA